MVVLFVIVMRPFAFCTRTGFATPTLVVGLTLVVDETVAFDVVLVREVLVVATAGDPEMLAGGLTTEAAVGESVRTLAKAVGEETVLLVGVIAVPEGAITGPAAFVTFVPELAVVVPVVADEPAIVRAEVDPEVVDPTATTPPAFTGIASPAPLVITSVGPE